jgi:beta-mannanase
MIINKKFRMYLFLFFWAFALVIVSAFVYKHRYAINSNFHIINNELLPRNNQSVSGLFFRSDSTYYDTLVNFTHFALTVNNHSSFRIDKTLFNEVPQNQDILLSIEFQGNKYLRKYKNDPLLEITNGSLDEKLKKIYDSLLDSNRKIYIRINPEMELWSFNFPWYNCYKYIDAYRHVALLWQNKNLKFIWGHSGFIGAERFYPGDDVVDFVSLTLHPGKTSYINEIHRNLHRLRFVNKPIMIMNFENACDNKLIYNYVNAEIDTIAKYHEIAYNDSLWKNSVPVIKDKKFLIGVYDPRKLLISDPAISLEHIFVSFDHIQSGESERRINEVFSRSHDVILTVEPWSEKPDSNILLNIIHGKYDSVIHRLYKDISDKKHTVYLRFAHEMEIPITRYTWQSQDPLTYIRAFRYFMQFPQQVPENVKRVWGPAGDGGSSDFYPGDDVVDYVSIAVYALPDKNITEYEKQFTFSSMFIFKTSNVRFINKPIFITEFGVKGPEEYKGTWLEDAARTLNKNQQVVGVNYFNMSDTPGVWGEIKEPDWSITPETLHRFLEVLERDNQ